jgi:hypothetical protein
MHIKIKTTTTKVAKMTTLMMNSNIERSVIDMCTSFACMMVRDMATRHGLDAETERNPSLLATRAICLSFSFRFAA